MPLNRPRIPPRRCRPAVLALALVLAAPMAEAACYADYKAKQDAPLRLHYGVIQLPDSACAPGPAAAEIARLGTAAKEGTAKRDELVGSTITITSLGPLGAIASTPILNVPEVAIVGVNRLAVRPFWNGAAFEPRKMMNLSCSFDHRVIDGWDAAVFVARLKELLETPALIFVEG